MTNATNGTKTQIKTATLRVETLRAELNDEYTVRLGPAAEKCVGEALVTAEQELAWLRAPRAWQ